DTGYFDDAGDLFVTGRVDDMIISGGENISPVEIESCLSLHPAVSEVAVVGIADERWGKVVSAFVKRRCLVEADELDQFCRSSGAHSCKRPRRYVFVKATPKSPVGKLLRRKLVAGEYELERAAAFSGESPPRTLSSPKHQAHRGGGVDFRRGGRRAGGGRQTHSPRRARGRGARWVRNGRRRPRIVPF